MRGSGARNHPQNEGEQHHGGVSAPVTPRPLPTAQFQDVPSMLAHFGALVGVRAALQQQLEAGQQRLAQGRARLQRYHEEAGGELLRGRDEVLQLRARLEAARHDVLQGVRGAAGPPGPPLGGEGLECKPLIAAPFSCGGKMPYGVVMGREHKGGGCWEVQGMWGTGRAVCLSVRPPGVLLDPDPERGRPQGPAAGADPVGGAEPLPARHQAPEGPQGRGPGGHRDPAGCGECRDTGTSLSLEGCGIRAPISPGAAVPAGPGCRLC